MSKSNAVSPLEPELKRSPKLSLIEGKKGKDLLDTRENGKTIREQLFEFALTPLTVLIVLSVLEAWAGKDVTKAVCWGVGVSGVLLALYKFAPQILTPLWRGWLKIGALLGMVMSNAVLGVMWFLLFLPISVFMKMTGNSAIDTKFREVEKTSYWETRDSARDDMKLMDRQF